MNLNMNINIDKCLSDQLQNQEPRKYVLVAIKKILNNNCQNCEIQMCISKKKVKTNCEIQTCISKKQSH